MKDYNFTVSLTGEQITKLKNRNVADLTHTNLWNIRIKHENDEAILTDIWEQIEPTYLAFLEEEKERAAEKEEAENLPPTWEEQSNEI